MTKSFVASLELLRTRSIRYSVPAPAGTVYERDFPETFVETIDALNSSNIAYALGWIMAYGLYAPARFTGNINILPLLDSHSGIKTLLLPSAFNSPATNENEFLF